MDNLPFNERLLLAVAPALVTALLAGVLVPLVLKLIETRKAAALKRLEAALARQTKVIEAQAALLDELTKALWAWRYQMMRVTHGSFGQTEDTLQAAWQAYDAHIWESLHAIRMHSTRARRLVSPAAYASLLALYEEIVGMDRQLGIAMGLQDDDRSAALQSLNAEVYGRVSTLIDEVLHRVAEEVQLTAREAAP